MKNAIILHGKPSREKWDDPKQPRPHEANWLPWLAAQLEKRGIEAYRPAMPEPYAPNYDAWTRTIENYYIGRQTRLIGHSAGAGFWARWMSENPSVEVQKIAMVAPWLDPNHRYGDLFEFKLDRNLAQRSLSGLAIFYSSLDNAEALQSAEFLIENLPGAKAIDIPNYGHYMLSDTMVFNELPEVLDELL